MRAVLSILPASRKLLIVGGTCVSLIVAASVAQSNLIAPNELASFLHREVACLRYWISSNCVLRYPPLSVSRARWPADLFAAVCLRVTSAVIVVLYPAGRARRALLTGVSSVTHLIQ